MTTSASWPWPATDEELTELQTRLGWEVDRVTAADPWSLPDDAVLGACVVAFAAGEAGPGHAGDRAWAAAVAWRWERSSASPRRPVDAHLRGIDGSQGSRQADDVLAQVVVCQRVPAAYAPGLLARREGPVLAAAVDALELRPDVLLVDATGLDHPRGAGLAVHLGAVVGIPTVGVTHRPLLASGAHPELVRGARSPVGRRVVGAWVCTRTGVRPVVAHAAWRTSADTAVEVVLAASTEAARTPVPLQEARRAAREARALAETADRRDGPVTRH